MKFRRIATMAVTLVMLLSFTAFAASSNYNDKANKFSVTLPGEYIILNQDNLSEDDNAEFIKRIGYSVKTFGRKMNDSGIVMYAATDDNRRQVQVKKWQSDFSNEIGSLTTLSDDQKNTAMKTIGEQLVSNGDTLISAQTVKNGDNPFFKYTVQVGDSFCYVQYITVVDSGCVSMVYYNSEAQISDEQEKECETIFKTFSITAEKGGSIWGGYGLAVKILSAVLLAAAVVVIVFIIGTFVRDIRNGRNKQDVIPDKIKMKRK